MCRQLTAASRFEGLSCHADGNNATASLSLINCYECLVCPPLKSAAVPIRLPVLVISGVTSRPDFDAPRQGIAARLLRVRRPRQSLMRPLLYLLRLGIAPFHPHQALLVACLLATQALWTPPYCCSRSLNGQFSERVPTTYILAENRLKDHFFQYSRLKVSVWSWARSYL